MSDKLIVNFDDSYFGGKTLFTGRQNGKKAKTHFQIKNADFFIIKANADQVITSSYFLGLLSEELMALLKKLNNINELIDRVDTSSLNEVSKNECIRAIRRGLADNELI
ncbi:hypothetical protein [Providencia sp. PROV144]|uniref:hypothetical protein n=1 Tax=Providencia sp. PROV144 TaxID=2949854 RepID=UPI00234AE901|nr:hypothetical protein [Providencia sp. PROV144]